MRVINLKSDLLSLEANRDMDHATLMQRLLV